MKNFFATFGLAMLVLPGAAAADGAGYPTLDRVEYVLECMRNGKGPTQELLYKCSCAIDAIAAQMPYEEYISDGTAAKALTIGGERGEVMRGFTDGRKMARRLRDVQADARKSCFLP